MRSSVVQAIQHVKIADEILNSRPYITESQLDYQHYWEQVKQEINKL
jgi:hypothetical protein